MNLYKVDWKTASRLSNNAELQTANVYAQDHEQAGRLATSRDVSYYGPSSILYLSVKDLESNEVKASCTLSGIRA